MTLDEYQSSYEKLLVDSAISKQMIDLLKDWSLELIKANQLDAAQDKVDEFIYRAFIGDLTPYKGYQFFSFRGFSDYSLNDIKTGKLSLAHPEEFNDPLDTVLFAYFKRQVKIETNPVNLARHFMVLKAANQLRMRCFVRTTPLVEKDGTPGKEQQDVSDINPLMWAHYAQYHTGFCACYELDDTFVKYSDADMSFTRMCIMDYKNKIDLSKGLKIGDAFSWKNAIWKYENEVRCIYLDFKNDKQFKEVDAPPLKAIYLGLKCSDENRHKMELALRSQRKKNVELYQMQIDPSNICKLIPIRIG